jgi:hypothetical protein
MAGTDEKVSAVAHCDRPHLTVVPIQSLNLLKLVSVPVADGAVFAATKEVVTVPIGVVRHKYDL